MSFLRLDLPMPPSDNHIYINTPKGRALTSTAKKYKNDVQRRTAEATLLLQKAFDIKNPYIILLEFYYERSEVLSTQHWRPFKKNDASNRTKLLIDAVTDGAGFDDGGLFFYLIRKNIAQDGITHVDVVIRLLTENLLSRWEGYIHVLKEEPDGLEQCADLGLDPSGKKSGG